jgi:hypothetical protein
VNCSYCGQSVTDDYVHWTCGGILPADKREYPMAVASHIVRLLTRRQGRNAKRIPWTAHRLQMHIRPELVLHFDQGLALAMKSGAVIFDGLTYKPAPAPKPVRTSRPKKPVPSSEPSLF